MTVTATEPERNVDTDGALDRPADRRPLRLRVGTQNTTEAGLSDLMASCDLVALQEADRSATLATSDKRMEWDWWPEDRDHGSLHGLGWDSTMFRRTGELIVHRFHRSASGDPDLPDGMKTASRYLVGVPLAVRATGEDVALWCTHVVQGYDSSDPDPHKDVRLRLAEHSFDVIGRVLERQTAMGRLSFLGADINTVHRPIAFDGYGMVRHSLDRLYYTRGPRLRLVDHRIGPKVGVGSQHRHESIVADFELTPQRLRRGRGDA